MKIGVQTRNIVYDENPLEGYELIKKSGFDCADFSLNSYLTNTSLYNFEINNFFDKSDRELEEFFLPHKNGASNAGVYINQMHMPYPCYLWGGSQELNDYLRNVVAPKSLKICKYLNCPNIVVHGFKLARNLGSEEEEWKYTRDFLEMLAPIAKEYGITICIENLYTKLGNHIVEGAACNAKKMVYRIDKLNDKYGEEIFGFCFDVGHANLIGIDFEEFIVTLGNRLKVLHIHDNDGIEDLHQVPFTFTKTRENFTSTNWDSFIEGLRKIEFDGVLSFETAPVLNSFPKVMKGDILKLISSIGRYFSNSILDTNSKE